MCAKCFAPSQLHHICVHREDFLDAKGCIIGLHWCPKRRQAVTWVQLYRLLCFRYLNIHFVDMLVGLNYT